MSNQTLMQIIGRRGSIGLETYAIPVASPVPVGYVHISAAYHADEVDEIMRKIRADDRTGVWPAF